MVKRKTAGYARVSTDSEEQLTKPFMKFAMPIQKVLLKCVKVPKNLASSVLKISGYKGNPFQAEFFEPVQQQKPLPCVLMIHGGAFGMMASPHHKKLVIRYAQELGCKVLFPDYHLMPEYPYPAGKEDVLSCYRYLCEHKDKLGIDMNRIAVAGDSAGAVLAVYVAQFDWKEMSSPCGQMLVYPVADAGQKTKSMQEFTDTPMWNAKSNAKMWEWYLADTAENEKQNASPMTSSLKEKIPPTYIETAEYDCLRDEGLLYAERLKCNGADVTVHETKGTIHGYDFRLKSKITEKSISKRIAFLKRVFKI